MSNLSKLEQKLLFLSDFHTTFSTFTVCMKQWNTSFIRTLRFMISLASPWNKEFLLMTAIHIDLSTGSYRWIMSLKTNGFMNLGLLDQNMGTTNTPTMFFSLWLSGLWHHIGRNQHFRLTYRLHLYVCPKDGGNRFLQNISNHILS